MPVLEAVWGGLQFVFALFWGREQAVIAAHGMKMPLFVAVLLTFGYYFLLGHYVQTVIERIPKLKAKIETARGSSRLKWVEDLHTKLRVPGICLVAHFPSGFWVSWLALNLWPYSKLQRTIIISVANTGTYVSYELVLGNAVEQIQPFAEYFAVAVQLAFVVVVGLLLIRHREFVRRQLIKALRA